MSWLIPFDEPIRLPTGRKLKTLEDAGDYITKLPKAEHQAREWQTAMHCLIQAADHAGPVWFARIGMMQALDSHTPRAFDPSRKDPTWRKRKTR